MPSLYCTTGTTTVTVIDTTSGTVQAELTMASSTNMASVSPSGAYAAVTFQTAGVQFVTTAGNTVHSAITTGLTGVFGLAWAPDSSKVYLQGQNAVQSCTPAGVLGPVWSVSGATNFSELAISPDGTKLYCPCGTVVKQVDTTSGATTATYTGFPNVYGVCVSPNGTMLYVTDGENPPTGGLYPVTIATGVVGTVLAVSPYPYGMCISRDGATLWCAQYGGDHVQTIATSTMTITHTVTVPTANEVAMTPDGATVWVGNFTGGTVVPVSTSTFTAGTPVIVGTQARGIGVVPSGGPPSVAMIATSGMTVVGTAPPPPSFPSNFVSASSASNSNGSAPLVITAPANIVAGNLLLAIIGGNSLSGNAPSAAGWTSVASHTSSNGDGTVWQRIAGSSEPSSYTWTGGSWLAGAILQYSGVAIDGTVVWADGFGTVATIPAATPSTASDAWLGVVYTFDGSTESTPSGFVSRAISNVAGLDGIAVFERALTSTSSTGTATSTVTPSDNFVTLTILLKSAGPAATTPSLLVFGEGATGATPSRLVVAEYVSGAWAQVATPWDAPGGTTPINIVNAMIWADSLKLFVAGGYAGHLATPTIMTSPDGINWTQRTTPMDGTSGSQVNCLAWNGSLLVAGGQATGKPSIMTSPDGVTWTTRSSTLDWAGSCKDVAWNGSYWLAVGRASSNQAGGAATSADGVTWTTVATLPWYQTDHPYPTSVVWFPSTQRWIVGGNTVDTQADSIMLSTNDATQANTWFTISTPRLTSVAQMRVLRHTVWAVGGSASNSPACKAYDGQQFNDLEVGTLSSAHCIFDDGTYYWIGGQGVQYRSLDGITWDAV